MKTQKKEELLEKMDELEKPKPVRKSKLMPSAKSPNIGRVGRGAGDKATIQRVKVQPYSAAGGLVSDTL
jgi:hypothetical protein